MSPKFCPVTTSLSGPYKLVSGEETRLRPGIENDSQLKITFLRVPSPDNLFVIAVNGLNRFAAFPVPRAPDGGMIIISKRFGLA